MVHRNILSAGAVMSGAERVRRGAVPGVRKTVRRGRCRVVRRGFVSFRSGTEGVRLSDGEGEPRLATYVRICGKAKLSGKDLGEAGVVWGLFCDFREILTLFTAKRLTTHISRDRISSEVS